MVRRPTSAEAAATARSRSSPVALAGGEPESGPALLGGAPARFSRAGGGRRAWRIRLIPPAQPRVERASAAARAPGRKADMEGMLLTRSTASNFLRAVS